MTSNLIGKRGVQPVKELWVSYSLQSMPGKKFVYVANKILNGEHFLVKPPQMAEISDLH